MSNIKTELFNLLLSQLESSLAIAIKAANDAHDLATHEQSKPETQYDTVGLEASYLAHGQSQRVAELKLAIKDWQQLSLKRFTATDEINAGALVQVVDEDNNNLHYLIGNYSGGIKLKTADKHIIVISTESPLGKALLNKVQGDDIKHPVLANHLLGIISVE